MVVSVSIQAADRIAVVNVPRIFQQLPEREAAIKQLKNEFQSRESTLRTMEHTLQMKIKHLSRNRSRMNAMDRKRLEKEIIKQRKIFSNKAHIFEKDHRRRQIEERNKILSRIQKALQSVARKDGYDVVIDANVVAYIGPSKDITSEVLHQVQ